MQGKQCGDDKKAQKTTDKTKQAATQEHDKILPWWSSRTPKKQNYELTRVKF